MPNAAQPPTQPPALTNADVFTTNPREFRLPNEGVTTLGIPKSPEEWETLRWELSSFVCEGQYAAGMKRLLETYLRNEGQSDQPGWWVSGFYGSGKSHFVRVLEHLWAGTVFPDGTPAGELVSLPPELDALFKELATAGRRAGGLWAASGTLGAAAEGSVRLGFAEILFRAAGLPRMYQQGRLVMWLTGRGALDAVRGRVEALGETWEGALHNLFVSDALAQAILEHVPGFEGVADVRASLRTQFAQPTDLSEEELLQVTAEVMALRSSKEGKQPCTLIVLDEVQQFIGDNMARVDQVARIAESMTKRFGGRLLLVATGQSAMSAMPQLAKIKDRFPLSIELSSTDVEQVVRQVILHKKVAHLPAVETALDNASGEIARHLAGTPLAYRESDHAGLASDYPLLPTRRRLWERFLQGAGSGSSTQLRSQLRITLDANRAVAERPLGEVVGADFVYRSVAGDLRSSGALPDDLYTMLERLGASGSDPLRQRVAQLLFVLSKLDDKLGVRPTEGTLADLLVEDLRGGGGPLRAQLPAVLASLVESGEVMKDGPEYRLQTREGAEWNGAFAERYRALTGDAVRWTAERSSLSREALEALTRGSLALTQGQSKTARKAELHYAPPPAGSPNIPVWVRPGWDETLEAVRDDARKAGPDSPTIYVYLPEPDGSRLRDLIATKLAASDVLEARPLVNTDEARQARAAMLSRRDLARSEIENLLARSLDAARILQGGGQEVEGGLRSALKPALEASVQRLYPRFPEGDNARWDTVRRKALEGDQTALEKAGYLGSPADHPVLKAVSGFIGAGKKGSEVRKFFTGVPYGWPQEAVDSALILLTSLGHLKASVNGSPQEARQLDGQTLPKVDFKPETVTLSAPQRVAVRGLFQKLGLSSEPGKEAVTAGPYLTKLAALLEKSGGEAPQPERLSSAPLTPLGGLSGNELLLELATRASELQKLREDAQARAEQIERRLDHWDKLSRLLRHSTNPDFRARADAIREHRLLLSDPDQIQPLATDVMNGLRRDLQAARAAYADAYAHGLSALDALPQWAALSESERAGWLSRSGLAALPEEKLGSITEVVQALEARGLSEWEAQTLALGQRFDAVRGAFLKSLEPTAITLRPPAATLKSAADVDAYLSALRREMLEAVEAGRPVIVGG